MNSRTPNPLKGWQLDREAIRFVGHDLQRPECILAEPDGTLWAADAREAERGAASQTDATGVVVTTMEQMSASIALVADGTEQVRANALHSLNGTQEGSHALDLTQRSRPGAHRLHRNPPAC
ncbi:hypothetical protein [Azoarcus sp. DD4]|uniref:hypothetical protein n=1 Tax=Azoarcus sp. DD4 TaxID=2027405 RepID=UPI00197AD9C4|nr:hypothetical protein [Azoarcus sp. DD4]